MNGALTVGVPRETHPGERRVAVTPNVLPSLRRANLEVWVEAGAGEAAGFEDRAYEEKGANVIPARQEVYGADVILRVRTPAPASDDLRLLRPEQAVAGITNALWAPAALRDLAERKVTCFAMDLMPRITRAQNMDVLSSQSTVAGYKAVLLAAARLPKMFPMLTTAAGTIAPARVFVIGAGVAGLQAIATARRLGAVVEAYDVRPAVREQVESVGAKFVELPLEAGEAEDRGGYAKALGEDFYRRQRELMARVVAGSDAVITTALIPGKPAPLLVTAEAVHGMGRGSVIVDLAGEQGGNCELSRPNEEVDVDGVTVLAPTNLPSSVAGDASQMYARNLSNFLLHVVADGKLNVDLEDQITRETLVCRGGEVVNERVAEALGATPAAAGGSNTEEA